MVSTAEVSHLALRARSTRPSAPVCQSRRTRVRFPHCKGGKAACSKRRRLIRGHSTMCPWATEKSPSTPHPRWGSITRTDPSKRPRLNCKHRAHRSRPPEAACNRPVSFPSLNDRRRGRHLCVATARTDRLRVISPRLPCRTAIRPARRARTSRPRGE